MIRVPNPEGSTDHMMLDASVTIEEEILLERRRDGCIIAGIDFDQDAELREMRDPRNWIETLEDPSSEAIKSAVLRSEILDVLGRHGMVWRGGYGRGSDRLVLGPLSG